MENQRAAAPKGQTILALAVTWLVMYMAIRVCLEAFTTLGRGGRLALAFIPTPIFVLFLLKFVRALRSADELERRIQLEALAVAFPLGMLLLTTLGLVQRAVTLNFQDWSYNHVWPIFALFYVIGLVFARSRYR